MKENLKRLAYLLLFVTISAGCKKDKPDVPKEEKQSNYVSASPIKNYTNADIQGIAIGAGFGKNAPYFKYDVEYVKISYKTTFKGKQINASGLLGIPKGVPTAPSIISAQHGTIFVDVAAPTNLANSPEAFSGLELLASAGFITAVPDYIGYGDTKTESHPYYDMAYAASAVVDMLTATKAYLAENKIATSNRLFLTGYSEGGYITMAAQKEIESNPDHGLTITAVAAGAGAYDLTEMLKGVATSSRYDEPGFVATLLNSYNSLYEWNRPLTDFFQEPYAGRIPGLLDGTNNRNPINAALSKETSKFFNPTFYKNLSISTEELKLKAALEKNSFNNWIPKAPVRLYHGTNDEAVYIKTTKVTYDRFKAGGANVSYDPFIGTTHQGSFRPMMEDVLPWFISLDK